MLFERFIPRGVFVRILSGLLASSLVALVVMSLMAGLAIKRSIMNWNQDKKADLEAVLIPMIIKDYRMNGGFDADSLEAAVIPYMTDSIYVYIFDAQKRAVLLVEEGRRISLFELRDSGRSPMMIMSKFSPLPIDERGKRIGYLAVDSADFLAYKANRQFVETMRSAILVGGFIAIVLCLLVAILFSRSFSNQTKDLAAGLGALSQGNRAVSFPESGTRELAAIAQSAAVLQNQLESEERLRMQWMQDISHDLRTPVAAIKSQFEAMIDGVLDTTPQRVERLLAELNHVMALVGNLQELSRYESPEMRITVSTISAQTFLDDIRDRFSILAEQAALSLECDGEPCSLLVDELLIQRCVSNIVQNALQHTAAGGCIKVSLEVEGFNACIKVSNTGRIPAETLAHMFDRLFRGNSARSDGGSGLGLSIAKAIMSLHGGSIRAENRGDSAVFFLSLPGRALVSP